MKSMKYLWIIFAAAGLFLGAAPVSPQPEVKKDAFAQIGKQWGIRPLTIRLTGADHFLDFRYKVIDPEKASGLLQKKQLAYLLHEASGTKMPVPVTKLGPLRATAVKAKQDKHYSVLFNNVEKMTKKGDKVTVVIGECRIENLVVNPVVAEK